LMTYVTCSGLRNRVIQTTTASNAEPKSQAGATVGQTCGKGAISLGRLPSLVNVQPARGESKFGRRGQRGSRRCVHRCIGFGTPMPRGRPRGRCRPTSCRRTWGRLIRARRRGTTGRGWRDARRRWRRRLRRGRGEILAGAKKEATYELTFATEHLRSLSDEYIPRRASRLGTPWLAWSHSSEQRLRCQTAPGSASSRRESCGVTRWC
jgi:hypothetical protein